MFKQKGLSLVELMIAVALGLILLIGVMQVFLSSKKVFSSQQALSRIQESGRMAIEFMSCDIRMAGFMGCASRSEVIRVTNMLNQANTVTYNFAEAVRGYASASFPSSAAGMKKIKTDTDVIALRFANNGGGRGVYVTKNNNGSQLFVNNNGDNSRVCKANKPSISGLCSEDILVVTDCEKAAIFQAANIKLGSGAPDDKVNIVYSGASMTPGNAVAAWGGSSDKQNTFSTGAQILFATSTIYYIADGASGQPALYQNVNGINLELLEGVEDMHITYGVDTDANTDNIPNDYRPAADVADWSRVLSARIELLVVSLEDKVVADKQVYSFPTSAAAKTSADFKLRQVFTTTVALRNRIN